jgi:hypothetical protein
VGRKNTYIIDFLDFNTAGNGCCLFLFGGIVINGIFLYAVKQNAFLCGCKPHIGFSGHRIASELMMNAGDCIL